MKKFFALAFILLCSPVQAMMGMVPVINDSGLTQGTRLYYGKMTTGASLRQLGVIDTALRSLDAAGILTKLDVVYLNAANARQTGLLNLLNPGTYTASETDGANLSFTVCTGFTGNGSSSGLDTNWNFTSNSVNYTLNSAHAAVWVTADSGAADTFDLGKVATGGGDGRIGSHTVAGFLSARINDGTSLSSAVATGVGYSLVNRTSSTAREIFKNGVSLSTGVLTSTSLPTTNLAILRNGGVFSSRQVAIVHVGSLLSSMDVASLYTIWQTYLANCS